MFVWVKKKSPSLQVSIIYNRTIIKGLPDIKNNGYLQPYEKPQALQRTFAPPFLDRGFMCTFFFFYLLAR